MPGGAYICLPTAPPQPPSIAIPMPESAPSAAAVPLPEPAPAVPDATKALVKDLRRRLLLKEFELRTMLSVAQEVTAQQFDEADLLRILKFTLRGQRSVEQVLLFVRDAQDKGRFRPLLSLGRELREAPDTRLPDNVFAHATAQPLALAGLGLAPVWDAYELVLPILRHGKAAAYVFVGGLRDGYEQSQLLEFLSSLTNIVIGAIENLRQTAQRVRDAAVRREVEIAQDVQQLLFPRHLPNDPHLAVSRSYEPHTEVGGDYYDVVEIDEHRLMLCVADVSGKGIPASLLMSNFQAGLRTLLRQHLPLEQVVPELNHLLFRNSGGEKFITAFLGVYDRRTRLLEYVNAGHNDPLLLPDAGPVLRLHDGTVMLGIMEKLPPTSVGRLVIPPRSLLLLYTDGLTEVFDAEGNEFGEEGILDVLRTSRYLPLPGLHDELLRRITVFSTRGQHFADDVTILSCRFK